MKKIIKKNIIIILFIFIFLPSVSFAAEMFFSSVKDNFSQNEDFLVQVFIDTNDERVNAVEGIVLFPSDLLEVKEVRDGNSSINFWIEKPESVEVGKVSFSGITTGGFRGEKKFLFSLIFNSKEIGNGLISFDGLQVLQNDGLGTKIATKDTPFSFTISKNINNNENESLKQEDDEMPEDFNSFIANDPSIFDGNSFVVFSTVDKGTGIDHYEVKESFWGWTREYIIAQSPYLLKDQTLKSKIYIKALDKAGNMRIVKIGAQNKMALLEQYLILGILLAICIFVIKKIKAKNT